jgi:hypothetical protein
MPPGDEGMEQYMDDKRRSSLRRAMIWVGLTFRWNWGDLATVAHDRNGSMTDDDNLVGQYIGHGIGNAKNIAEHFRDELRERAQRK